MHFAVPATIAAAGDGSVVPTGRKTPAHMARRYRPTGPQGHRPRGVGAAAPGQIEPLCACVGSCDLPGPRPGAAAQPRLSRDTGNRAPPGPTRTCWADVHRPWQARRFRRTETRHRTAGRSDALAQSCPARLTGSNPLVRPGRCGALAARETSPPWSATGGARAGPAPPATERPAPAAGRGPDRR